MKKILRILLKFSVLIQLLVLQIKYSFALIVLIFKLMILTKVGLLCLLAVFLSAYECQLDPSYQERMERDLYNFRDGVPPSMLRKLKKLKRAVYITIKNHTATASDFRNPRNVGKFWESWRNYFLGMASQLPDMQFLVNLYDEPRSLKGKCSPEEDWRKCACDKDYQIPDHSFFIRPCEAPFLYEKLPIFSAGTLPECFNDLLVPSPFHIIDRSTSNVPWEHKQFKAFWRGGSTGMNLDSAQECDVVPWAKEHVDIKRYHRVKLITKCRQIQDCDAGFSKMKQCSKYNCNQLNKNYSANYVNMYQQSKFKLLIDIDGNTYSERFPVLLKSGSVVLKIFSFLDIGVIPAKAWVHYIPVRIDLTDLEEKIQWAKENDEELQRIGQKGKQLSFNTLTSEQYRCYTIKLLTQYSTLLVTQEQYEANIAMAQQLKEQSSKNKGKAGNKKESFQQKCEIDPAFEDRIAKDLAQFSDGITPKMIQKSKAQPQVHVITVKNHKITSKGSKISFSEKIFFESLAEHIPDMEFAVNTIDQPRVIKNGCRSEDDWKKCSCDKGFKIPPHGFFMRPNQWMPIYDHIPIFSPVTLPECFGDILIPPKYSLATKKIINNFTWKDRQFKAIWRGSTQGGNFRYFKESGQPLEQKSIPFSQFHRHKLVDICSKIGDCDAKFSKYEQCDPKTCTKMRQQYGRQQCVSMQSQSINKIVIDIDGNSHSDKFSSALATGSAVIKISFFLDLNLVVAKPWVHYVPVNFDLSDLRERIDQAKQNDKDLEKIGSQGRQLVENTLTFNHYKCYMIKLLKKYHSLFISDEDYDKKMKEKNK